MIKCNDEMISGGLTDLQVELQDYGGPWREVRRKINGLSSHSLARRDDVAPTVECKFKNGRKVYAFYMNIPN